VLTTKNIVRRQLFEPNFKLIFGVIVLKTPPNGRQISTFLLFSNIDGHRSNWQQLDHRQNI
jgi:hypothetical protein